MTHFKTICKLVWFGKEVRLSAFPANSWWYDSAPVAPLHPKWQLWWLKQCPRAFEAPLWHPRAVQALWELVCPVRTSSNVSAIDQHRQVQVQFLLLQFLHHPSICNIIFDVGCKEQGFLADRTKFSLLHLIWDFLRLLLSIRTLLTWRSLYHFEELIIGDFPRFCLVQPKLKFCHLEYRNRIN